MDRVTDDVDAVRTLARLCRVLERACPDLSLAHYRVLAAIADGEQRASQVAARLALGKPTISASVDALCRRGLLVRQQADADQRVTALRLTSDGEKALHDAEVQMLERIAAVLAHVEDAGAVLAALDKLGAGLDLLADERLAGTRR